MKGDGKDIPTFDLGGAKKEDFAVVDGDFKINESPQLDFAFGGRLKGDDYIQTEDEQGQKQDLHLVHLDLVCTTPQYIALLKIMSQPVDEKIIHINLTGQ